MASIALEQEVIAAAITTARLLCCIYTLLMCTNTACSTRYERTVKFFSPSPVLIW